MKYNIKYNYIAMAVLLLGTASCSDDQLPSTDNENKLPMEFIFNHPTATRATETSFEKDDIVGIYVTENSLPLEISGNTVNNEQFKFNGNTWLSIKNLYWDDGSFDVYGYYPYTENINSTTDLDFEVKTDQRDNQGGGMSNYEASDFLYASAKNVEASANPVALQFRHIMSKLTIRLIKGEDYEGELPETATVYIHSTVTQATIDLTQGIATKYYKGTNKSIIARQVSPTSYSAIVVPQRLDNRVPLIEVVMNGVSYLYESRFQFKPGMHHLVNLVIDTNPDQVKIEIGGEITNWN